MFWGLGSTSSGTRSTISRPNPSRPPYLAGLLVSSRIVVMPRSTRIWAPMPYSRLSTGSPSSQVGVDGVAAFVLQLVGRAACGRCRCPGPRGRAGTRPRPGPRSAMRCIAASSCGPQSQRSEPNTSPVRHSLCTRTSTFSSPCTAPLHEGEVLVAGRGPTRRRSR